MYSTHNAAIAWTWGEERKRKGESREREKASAKLVGKQWAIDGRYGSTSAAKAVQFRGDWLQR